MTSDFLGPVLILDDARDGRLHLSALIISDEGTAASLSHDGGTVPFVALTSLMGRTVSRARFSVPLDQPSRYSVAGQEYQIACGLAGDVRLAFASCNGEETGDLNRQEVERNVMWARLRSEHASSPFSLLLQGCDQIYADEATKGHPLSARWPDKLPKDPSREALADLKTHLRCKFFERYQALLTSPDYAWLVARIPQLSQWDDHDICDGWGSLPRSRTYSRIGRTLFEVAREMALLFQHGTIDGDLPARFHDPKGHHLGWVVDLPDLRLIAPDLRSERTRRNIMGAGGWTMMECLADRPAPARVLMVSSVPLLGPRLSILEALMVVIPKMQHYEDDLRDQWQSRAHRAEWQRMLGLLRGIALYQDTDITVLSGEIHLATRAVMQLETERYLHQLVASGVTHRAPPKAWARVLGALASLGEDPLPKRRIAIHPVPGQRRRYIAERNALTLGREGGRWSAVWHFEHSGQSDPLVL